MQSQRVVELSEHGQSFEDREAALAGEADTPAFEAFAEEVHRWLLDCVACGRVLPTGSPERRRLQGIVDYWTSRLLQSGRGFSDVDRIAAFDPSAGEVLPDDRFPYHGLVAVTDPSTFFGREEQIGEYVAHLEAHRALLIQSESGGGKSSIAMAGVVPTLRRAHPHWLVVPRVAPGTRPADALRAALAPVLGLGDVAAIDADAVRDALDGKALLLYIDQLEELLTMCNDVDQQADFSGLVSQLANACGAKILATLRIDHYERLAHSPACHALYSLFAADGSVKTLLPMSLAQIRSVIQKPADAVGLRFVPPAIVERLAGETANAPSGLPLLQFALQRLWQERPRNAEGEPLDMVNEATYARLPTLRGALGAVAQEFFEELSERGLVDACQRLMLELTVIDERLEVPLRRRRGTAEVIAVLTGTRLASHDDARWLIDGLVTRRVMVRSGAGDAEQIEVAHEALFRYWDRFQDWFSSEGVRATLRETRQLARDALLWEQGQESGDLLKVKGLPLKNALGYRAELWLDALTVRYVDACEAAAVAQTKREHEALAAHGEAERARRIAHRLRITGVYVGLMVIALAAFGAYFVHAQRVNAELQATAVASFASDLNALDALDLAYTQQRLSPAAFAHAIDRLAGSEMIFQREIGGADFTPSGFAVVQLVRDGDEVRAVNVKPLGRDLQPWRKAVVLTWKAVDDDRLASIDVGPRPVGDAPDTRLVAANFYRRNGSVQELSRVVVWRIVEDSAEVRQVGETAYPPGTSQTSDIAFAAGGEQMAVVLTKATGDPSLSTRLRVWPVAAGPATDTPSAAPGEPAVTTVAFGGPGGDQLVLGRDDGSVHCNDRVIASAERSPVVALRAAPSSSRYVAVHSANSVTVGDCATGAEDAIRQLPERPHNLVLRASPAPDQPARHLLSYIVGGRLVCRYVPAITGPGGPADSRGRNRCWVPDWSIDGALPIVSPSGVLAGYRALPYRSAPLLTALQDITFDDGAASSAATSTSGGRRDAGDVDEPSAISPNGLNRITITKGDGPQQRVRLQSSHRADVVVEVSSPGQMAINDRGVAAVLGGAAGPLRGVELTLIDVHGQTKRTPLALPDASCLTMSPDGAQILIAGEQLGFVVLALDAAAALKPVSTHDGGNQAGAALAACSVGDGPKGRLVLATRDGMVFEAPVTGGALQPVSELVAFRLPGAAIDVSIDAGSRFIAVLGDLLISKCLNGMSGHTLRIWDRQGAHPEFPVASGCLARSVQAIGALEHGQSGWVLPLYEPQGDGLKRSTYPCLACEGQGGMAAVERRLEAAAAPYAPALLDESKSRRLYGFAP